MLLLVDTLLKPGTVVTALCCYSVVQIFISVDWLGMEWVVVRMLCNDGYDACTCHPTDFPAQ